MSMRSGILVLAAVLFAQGVQAQNAERESGHRAEVALSNDTLQLSYIGGGEMIDVARSQVFGTFFLSEERDIVLSGGLLYPANLDLADLKLGRLSLSFGPQVYAALLEDEDENSDVFAISVGTEIRFDLDRSRGLAIVGRAFYAPDILTFGSADNLTDLSARAEIRLGPQLTAFGGMRWFEFDLTEGAGTRTLQEELFAGVGWRF